MRLLRIAWQVLLSLQRLRHSATASTSLSGRPGLVTWAVRQASRPGPLAAPYQQQANAPASLPRQIGSIPCFLLFYLFCFVQIWSSCQRFQLRASTRLIVLVGWTKDATPTSLSAHRISHLKVGWLAANDIKVGGYTMTAIDGWMAQSNGCSNVGTRLRMDAATICPRVRCSENWSLRGQQQATKSAGIQR